MSGFKAAHIGTSDENSALFSAAATGDIAAQRILRQKRIDDTFQGGPYATLFALEALSLSRICAAHGQSQDARVLAGLLCQNAATFRGSGHAALGDAMMMECIGILEALAADGDDMASVCANALIPEQSRHVLDCVRQLTEGSHE